MDTEQNNVDLNKSQTVPNNSGDVVMTVTKQKNEVNANISKISRSKWGYGRPAQFLEDRSRIHFGVRTTKDRVGPSFVQKVIVDHTYETAEPQQSVEVLRAIKKYIFELKSRQK